MKRKVNTRLKAYRLRCFKSSTRGYQVGDRKVLIGTTLRKVVLGYVNKYFLVNPPWKLKIIISGKFVAMGYPRYFDPKKYYWVMWKSI